MALKIWKKYSIGTVYNTADDNQRTISMSATALINTIYDSVTCTAGSFTGNGGHQATIANSVGSYWNNGSMPSAWMDRIVSYTVSGNVATVVLYQQKIVAQSIPSGYIQDVTAEEGTYPTNGQSGGFWYVLQPTYAWKKYTVGSTGYVYHGTSANVTLNPGDYYQVFDTVSVVNDSAIGGSGEKRVQGQYFSGVIGKYFYTANTIYLVWAYNSSTRVVSGYPQIIGRNYNIGTYLEDVISPVSNTYPQNGQSGGFWYVSTGMGNIPPSISGNATDDLGNKNLPFNITYSVDDIDSGNVLNIIEKLNGVQTKSIPNAVRNTIYNINITQAILNNLTLNTQNTIEIIVSDGTTSVTKTVTFKKTSLPPTISNTDKSLGVISRKTLLEKYICNTYQSNPFTIVEKINNTEVKRTEGVSATEYSMNIPKDTWLKLPNGDHKYTVSVVDSLGLTQDRVFNFSKKETIMQSSGLTKIIATNSAATKILLSPLWNGINNADVVIEVCNNGYDAAPTWENATSQVLVNKSYIFTNKTKTAAMWGINVKFKITRKTGTTDIIEFFSIAGAFEI